MWHVLRIVVVVQLLSSTVKENITLLPGYGFAQELYIFVKVPVHGFRVNIKDFVIAFNRIISNYILDQIKTHVFNFFNTASYARISSGSCEEYGMYTISSKAICEAAAQVLALKDTTAYSYSSTNYPNGCSAGANYHDHLLINNSPAEFGQCGYDTYDCICTTKQSMYLQFYCFIYGRFIINSINIRYRVM